MKKVRIALLQEQDVGLILAKVWNAGRVDGAELFPVDLGMVLDERRGLLQGLEKIFGNFLQKNQDLNPMS